MKDPLRHLPFVLVAALVLFVGFVGLSVRVEVSALAALLAPMLWLGLYGLGTSHDAGVD